MKKQSVQLLFGIALTAIYTGAVTGATTCNITPAHTCTHLKPNPGTGMCPGANGKTVCPGTPEGQCPGKQANKVFVGFPIGADVANATSTPDSAGNNHYTEHSNVGTEPANCWQPVTCTWGVPAGGGDAICGVLQGSEQQPAVESKKISQTCS